RGRAQFLRAPEGEAARLPYRLVGAFHHRHEALQRREDALDARRGVAVGGLVIAGEKGVDLSLYRGLRRADFDLAREGSRAAEKHPGNDDRKESSHDCLPAKPAVHLQKPHAGSYTSPGALRFHDFAHDRTRLAVAPD